MRVSNFSGGFVDVAPTVPVLCGSVAEFDHGSGYGYRCTTCGAVLGSIGMPDECAELYKKQEAWKVLGGKAENDYYGT